ncbi:lanthionine synthetase LanC family protein [Microbacterium sp. B2969]|uniref:Lanthionine synthetase LanC family protein n=1 Tax=Microbacterium alkaliflavum TaxID=3248839 RepID=A0ABW7QDL6_9MICO
MAEDGRAYVLAPGVVVRAAAELRPDVRRQLDLEPGDHVVTLPTARTRSLLVDKESARVLALWRRAATAEAITAEAASAGIALTRDDLEDLRARLVGVGYLLPDRSDRPSSGDRLADGARVGSFVVTARVQEMPDKAVYLAAGPDGTRAALKIAASGAPEATTASLDRERRILATLELDAVPRLLDAGEVDGRPYVGVEWRDGADVLTRANGIRSEASSPALAAPRLRDLVAAMLDAYATLHDAGVVHGDIHPKNVIVGADGGISLIDFELASGPGLDPGEAIPRGGVPYFYEPGYARALLAGRGAPEATRESDLHGLVALTYLLITGRHYLPFRLERTLFYRQIAERDMQPFAHAVDWSWPSVELLLEHALRDGAGSAAELARGIRALDAADLDEHPTAVVWPRDFLRTFRLGRSNDTWPFPAPSVSLHHGAAGVAVALISAAGSDPAALADAARWSHRSNSAVDDEHLVGDGSVVGADVTRPWSLHYGAAGVHLVSGLIANARGNAVEAERALAAYCACAADLDVSASPDLMSGAAGWLLGAVHLEGALPASAHLPSRGELVETADDVAHRLGEVEASTLPAGVAHGRAGIAYATLLWAAARLREPPPGAVAVVRQLAQEQRTPSRPGWTAPEGWQPDRAARFASSWCNGSAGLALTFCAAYDATQDAGLLDAAEHAAQVAVDAGSNGSSLCCGDAGLAYALAALGRRTGRDEWQQLAREVASRAAAMRHGTPHSLYKGLLGARLADVELNDPASARFPLFEPEVWPMRWSYTAPPFVRGER